MELVRIPKKFYDDHVERELPAPPIERELSRHYVIDRDHPDFQELVSDARHYAGEGTDADQWVVMAARALVAAVTGAECAPAVLMRR